MERDVVSNADMMPMRARVVVAVVLSALCSACGAASPGPTRIAFYPDMIGDWTGTFAVSRLLDDGTARVNVCDQSWKLPCVITARSGIMGSVADGRLRAEWFEQGVCESGSLSRSILVEMTKG
jgi:hypothetical protein